MTLRSRPLSVLVLAVGIGAAGCGATPTAIESPAIPSPSVPSARTPALTPVPGGPPSPSGVPGADLVPTEAEQMLLDGIRFDLRKGCGPVRDGLPEAASGEVACLPADNELSSVAVDAFDDQATLLDAYFARLAVAGVEPRSNGGACAGVASAEGAWMPGDDATLAERGACWTDGDSPVYLTTQPPFVLITVTGLPGTPLETVQKFAWRGNEDVPGAPTVWRQFPTDAEK